MLVLVITLTNQFIIDQLVRIVLLSPLIQTSQRWVMSRGDRPVRMTQRVPYHKMAF